MINKILCSLKNNVVFLFVGLLVIVSRLFRLDSIPAGINQDEAYVGYEALSLLKYGFDSWGYNFPVYFVSWGSGMNVLYSYLLIPFFYLFGSSVFVLRLPQALCGILGCYVFYKIFRAFYSKRDALVALFLVGIMPWGIMASRFGLESNLLPLLVLLGFYFYLKAFKNSNYIFLSAFFYGVSLYAYSCAWVFVFVSIFAEYVYFICFKRTKEDFIKALMALVLFGVMFIPLFLFCLVNMKYIEEIKTSFFSIPKLTWWRSGEIGFDAFALKVSTFGDLIIKQCDWIPSNSLSMFGMFYHISLFFIAIGLMFLIKQSIGDLKNKRFSFSFVVLINIVIGVVYALMLYSNVNRVNYLWYFIIISIVVGVLALNKKVQIGVLFVYLMLFVKFISFYFTDYNEIYNKMFKFGLDKAISFIDKNPIYKDKAVYFNGFDDIHSSVLFLTKYPTDDFYRNVEWKSFPEAYLDARSFGKYIFLSDDDYGYINNNAIYILNHWDNKFSYDFARYEFGDFVVAVPRRFH